MKNFDSWNSEKKILHSKKRDEFYVNPREIWYTKMGVNIGFEENGKEEFVRPVLVLKTVGNLIFTVALTSKGKDKNFFYHKFKKIELQNPRYESSSYAVLSQVKVMDKKRFFKKGGMVPEKEFVILQKKLKRVLF
jgi:mRNA interferase MazF